MERPLWMTFVTHMFIEVYPMIQIALIPVIIEEFKLSVLEASLVAAVPAFVQLLMYIPSGFLVGRFYSNHLLFISMLIEGLSALLVSQTNSFWTLLLGVSLLKISSPIYHISGLSQITRLSNPEKISRPMGFHNAFGSLGSALGLFTLSVFLSTLGWRWTYFVWAFPILVWGSVILLSPRFRTKRVQVTKTEDRGGLKRLLLVFPLPFLVLLAVVGIREFGATGSSTFMTTYFVNARSLTDSVASLILGIGTFVGIGGSLCGGYAGERVGAKKALGIAITGCAMALLALSFAYGLYLLAFIYVIYAFFSNFVWSPMNTLVTDIVPVSEIGLAFSAYFFIEGGVASIAPTLAAGIIELTDVMFVFPYSITFLITSVIILQLLRQKKNSN